MPFNKRFLVLQAGWGVESCDVICIALLKVGFRKRRKRCGVNLAGAQSW